jgi:seryl-tRNA synthetase
MHDLKYVEENPEEFKKITMKRNFDVNLIDEIIALNDERKKLILIVENTKAEINKLSKEVGQKKQKGENADDLMSKVTESKAMIQNEEKKLDQVKEKLNYQLSCVPNLISEEAPVGKDETENKEIKKWGTPKTFSFTPKEHSDIGEALGMLDFEAATKITGARFTVYKHHLARLERALANYMIDFHLKNNYEEILPPYIVHERSLYGTGNLPKFKSDVFKIENQDWYLIPTAEVPVTNLKRESVFDAKEFPLKYVAYTPCFRSEAGSHGKDTKGLIRMHQFNKVEMVNIVHPAKSEEAHQQMVDSACKILEELGLPYRAMLLCSGDTGFSAKKTVDLEVWLPSQNCYREISSISNCGEFQARRAQIRFKEDGGKPQFAHTLNGSGLAVGRTLVAILENYQNEDGSVTLPEIIRPYMGGVEKLSRK